MNNVALGQYMPLDSVVHKMDPRSKIMIMLFLMVAIFIPAGVLGYVIIGIFILLSLYLSKLNIKYALRTMKPMLWMMAFLLVINLLVIKTGTPLFSIKGFTIYSDAVNQTLYIVVRLMLMVIITTVLTATTKPLDLTLGIEKLLKPFEKVGVPAHIIAMMISIALRFIPTLIEETQRIMNAQASRGVDLENGSMKQTNQTIWIWLKNGLCLQVLCNIRLEDCLLCIMVQKQDLQAERIHFAESRIRGAMRIRSLLSITRN